MFSSPNFGRNKEKYISNNEYHRFNGSESELFCHQKNKQGNA